MVHQVLPAAKCVLMVDITLMPNATLLCQTMHVRFNKYHHHNCPVDTPVKLKIVYFMW